MKLFRVFALSVAFAFFSVHPSFADESDGNAVSQVAPPELVACPTSTTCDRDPKHLEAYVTGFYRWYIENLDKLFQGDKNRVFEKQLTHRFITLHLKTKSITDIPDEDFCSSSSDLILCGHHWTVDMLDNAKVQILWMDKSFVKISVKSRPETRYGPYFAVVVRLRSENQFWKIDGVMDLSAAGGNLSPPDVVQCHSENVCDRDPKHLAAFVEKFYRWSASDQAKRENILWAKGAPMTKQRRRAVEQMARQRGGRLQKFITPELYQWIQISPSDDSLKDPRFCQCGEGLLCYNGGSDEQDLGATAEIVDVAKNSATALVTNMDYEPPVKFFVTLQVLDGYWRISGVRDPTVN